MEEPYKKHIILRYANLIELVDSLSTMYKLINTQFDRYDVYTSLDDNYRFQTKCFSIFFCYFKFKLNPFGNEGNHLLIDIQVDKDNHQKIIDSLNENNINYTFKIQRESYSYQYNTGLYSYVCDIDFDLDESSLNRIKKILLIVLNLYT